jgi:hypothetical protein
LNDRKKKAADEKRAREEEYEESKEQMERIYVIWKKNFMTFKSI